MQRWTFERDGYVCAMARPGCESVWRQARGWGAKLLPGIFGIQAHHLLPREHGGPDTLGNLVSLCFRCHAWVHVGRNHDEAVALGWLRERRESVEGPAA